MLIENLVFQELYKYQTQERKNWTLHYWRTKAGAEVDFVLKTDFNTAIPVEVKYRNSLDLSLTRGYKSFLSAYQPPMGFVITKELVGVMEFEGIPIHFIPLSELHSLFIKILS